MNIFYLDQNPKLCAQYHCDKHVVKMILESAQLLCTAVNVAAGEQITPYKSTHVNHPCSIWVRESFANWDYVINLMLDLEEEWNYRFHSRNPKTHNSVAALVASPVHLREKAEKYLPSIGLTVPPLCMPESCKQIPAIAVTPEEATILCYRNYYNQEKKHLHKWTNREVPFWINN